MWSCAAALVVLAIVTECLCADRSRSRERSPVRRMPVGADIKRDTDFNCPEEFGYYPHPTDCTLYYVCVFGGALLESCTGGLMYSHELQTCDWPRNVGCDGGSAVGGEELERISERDPPPPPPPPPRRAPPPPPRAQPNPIVTSRGQPKYSRDEYEKQQQLYAEVDDLPPVEEIESDRQQRVYRGQPSTIGQVQKDRDGYSSQVSPGRNFNTNIIPASIPQNNGKIGSFSFGSQVDERRTATVTPAPQSYSDDKTLTDSPHDQLLDIETNDISDIVTKKSILTRRKREVELTNTNSTKNGTDLMNNNDTIAERSSIDDLFEFYEIEPSRDVDDEDEHSLDDTERGKRQIRYYVQNGYKNPGKNWSVLKPIKFVDSLPQSSYHPQNSRYQPNYNNQNNNYYDNNRKPYSLESNSYSASNPFLAYQNENSQNSFKASLPDPYSHRPAHNPLNVATQIITKSPPISSLNNQNSIPQLTGGFYNNAPQSYQNNNNQYSSQGASQNWPHNQYSVDSSLLPSTVVTGKPVLMSTSPRNPQSYKTHGQQTSNDEEDSEEDYDSSEEEDNEQFGHSYPKPPYEFRHPSNKFANIENPFANPNFDFDEYLSKLSNGQYTTHDPRKVQQIVAKPVNRPVESSTPQNSGVRSSTLNYQGMSTPRPFSVLPNGVVSTQTPIDVPHFNSNRANEQYLQRPQPSAQTYFQQQPQNSNTYNQQQYQNANVNAYMQHHQKNPNINDSYQQQHRQQQYTNQNQGSSQNAGTPLEAVRPKLKPPNFKDDRQLPISYSFSKPIEISTKSHTLKTNSAQPLYSTAKPYLFLTATGTPVILSSPKTHFVVKNEKLVSHQPYQSSTGKPYSVSSISPQTFFALKHSTAKPLTTLANDQLSALHHYWKSTTESVSSQSVTLRPSTSPDVEKLKNLFAQAVKASMQTPTNNQTPKVTKFTTTTTTRPPKRRPIPKPSPEMNDYYYDDDDYYEPPVKSQYMPSTEIKPQRPHMAQNYKHYDENYDDSEEDTVVNISPRPTSGRPYKHLQKPETVTKNYNDVSVVTKSPLKDYNKNSNSKIPVPVLIDFSTPTPTVIIRPQPGSFEIVHGLRNRTIHMRRPHHDNGPNTVRPPKFLNQTTLRPYTVRHRLAKPTPVQDHTTQKDVQTTRPRGRHPNIVAQMLTTPHDNHNQETRITKAKYDGITNSLEPTESVAPLSYSPSPRPKMLYNGTQNYSPDQYDPFYAIYDEDGELYKDTDYVQQYNVASVRPAVQQTYRGTPPPARRPVDSYSPRPVPVSADDYDEDLIQGQINNQNQNQYQSPIRQSTRGEGNELGYEHIPNSVKTTIYEAIPISTTPSTTSTSTTTRRPTTAPYTEAMTPSRYTPRSSTDENPIPKSDSSSIRNSSEESISSIPSTSSPIINFSSLAKPFEKTADLHSLDETELTTEKISVPGRSFVINTNKEHSVEVVRSDTDSNKDKKKILALTTGFSIRRNSNNTNNPYTLTVLTRPFDDFDKSRNNGKSDVMNGDRPNRYFYKSSSESNEKPVEVSIIDNSQLKKSSESTMRRKDSRYEITDDYDIPVYVPPNSRSRSKTAKVKSTTVPSTSTTKYYLKSVVKRPASFASEYNSNGDFTENAVQNVHALIETGLQNVQAQSEFSTTTSRIVEITPKRDQRIRSQSRWNEPTVSPFRSLDNLRYNNKQESLLQDSTTNTASTTRFTTTTPKDNIYFKSRDRPSHLKPSYYSYKIEDEEVPDQTTEVFSSSVKNVIQAFFNSIVSTPVPQSFSTTFKPATSTTPKLEQKIVNIGFQKRPVKYSDEDKSTRQNVQRLKIITDPSPIVGRYITVSTKSNLDLEEERSRDVSSSTSTTMTLIDTIPYVVKSPPTTPKFNQKTSTNPEQNFSKLDYQSKFRSFIPTTAKVYSESTPQVIEPSRKFQNIIDAVPTLLSSDNDHIDDTGSSILKTREESNIPEIEWRKPIDIVSEIASTTSTTKSTSTLTANIDSTTKSTTKSVSYPTRASRVNPAIKLAASNPASGRRSYQSSSKCSSDNSLQANPKCNEIKYQRPTTSTRGRGSAHYSKSGSESAQPPNRGTPPTRSRPTLKPSTAIVSDNIKFSDIYENPPSRPAPVYPQPTPDKTAAKCRKDVCLLPDCYCGGKEIPGDLPVEQVPQIVLLTFDDSVNDLNKGLYADLFEKGRVNPNGCPITSTFYVSHEWTDYSQVQNLYSAGHEMASHTISHSFGEQFSQKKWNREVGGQREILAAYGGVKLEDVRGMRAPFLSIGGNKMFKMLYDSNFTYDSSMPVYENRPPSWPYTLDYKLFHDCMIPPCPTKSYPGVWEVPMVMWQDLNGGRCSMGDACANPPEPENVYKMLLKNFDRHYTTNRAPFGLFYHAAWFTQQHHKEGFIMFLDFINQMQDVWIVTNWQALQWVRDPTPISRLSSFQPFQCNYQDRPKKCNNPKVCNLWHKSGVRYMRTCQPCPEVYPWTGKTGIRSSRIDNDNGE